ncbi:MAG TPA: TMEM14 family protein [Verrucomicrobiae bacterium]|nr:TMEM14 family protein [Verrucomicrobiae bacterium]
MLFIGGLIGFFKAKSRVSLITAAIAAAVLILTRLPGVFQPSFGHTLASVIMVVLLIVFALRLSKTKRFMPSGFMMLLTFVVLVLLNFRRNW